MYVKINPADKAYLDSLFGANHVFDYSGINDITQSKFNYYERSHYLPRIATRIIREVYTGTTGDSVLVR